jgi:class 3 adenylate cyclase
VFPVPAREPAGSSLLRRVRDPAGRDLRELRDGPLSLGQVLPRLRSSRCLSRHTVALSYSYIRKSLAEKILSSKTALEGERKQVTVLFADLKGSMSCSQSATPRRHASSSTQCSNG